MPTLRSTADPSVTASFTIDEARAALESGEWAGAVETQDVVTGRQVTATPEQVMRTSPHEVAAGDASLGMEQALAGAEHEAYSGVGDQLLGAAEGAASVLTLSASDWALDQAGADTALRAEHTAGRTVGEVAAIVGTAFSPFGKGALAKALTKLPGGAVSKFGAGGKGALARVAHVAGEGTAYGLAQASTNLALAEPGVAAESWASELGQGALLGMALGGVAGVGSEAVRAVGAVRGMRKTRALDLSAGPGKDAVAALTKAQLEIDDIVRAAKTEHDVLAKQVIEASGGTVKINPRTFPEPDYRKIFDHLSDEALTPASFTRLLKMGESNPQELLKRVAMIDESHAAAMAAVKGNEVATARLAEATGAYKAALDNLVPAETQKLLSDPAVLGAILGASEVIVPEGTPGKSLLQLAAAIKLTGGALGRGGGGTGRVSRMINAIGKRASAGFASGLARGLPVVKRMGPAAGTAVAGGSASAGYEMYGWAQRTFFNGARSAVSAEAAARSGIAGAVERVANGTPVKARAMPATTMVLDRLLGDPEQASKTPQQKFKVIQERLSKFSVAPDAVSASMYELLKPVAEISEQLADMMEILVGDQLSYLQAKMPQDPGTMMMFGKSMWQPTDRELYEFSMCAMGVLMPLETVDLIADGLVPPQAAEALAATNPEIFTKMQQGIIERADEVRENSTYNQRISLGLAFQLPLDPTTDPRYVTFVQNMHAQKSMEQAAGSSGEGSTPEESYSDAQKLLA